jgi:hypothetical protein
MPAWAEAVIQRVTEYRIDFALPFAIPTTDFSFCGMNSEKETYTVADTTSLKARIGVSSTATLLGHANVALGTDPDDLIISALLFSF